MFTHSGVESCPEHDVALRTTLNHTVSCINVLKFRYVQIFAVSQVITLANNKQFFSKKLSIFLCIQERICALNKILPSDIPGTKQISRNFML